MTSMGYGPKGKHYLYASTENAPAVADNQMFKTREDAVKYLAQRDVLAAVYFSSETSFPDTIPGEITHFGTAFRVLNYRK